MHPKNTDPHISVSIWIDPSLHLAVKDAARREDRTLRSFIARALRRELAASAAA